MTIVLLLLGCNRLVAEVDGLTVRGAETVFFVEDEDYFGNDGAIEVILSTAEIGCEGYEDFYDDFEDLPATDADGMADLWQDTFPEDFWEFRIRLRVDDVDEDASVPTYNGVDWNEGLSDDDEARITVVHFTDHPTQDDFSIWGWIFGTSTDYVDLYSSDEGEVGLRRHAPGERVSGYFDADVVDWDDGDYEGDVRLDFAADRCHGMEDYLP